MFCARKKALLLLKLQKCLVKVFIYLKRNLALKRFLNSILLFIREVEFEE